MELVKMRITPEDAERILARGRINRRIRDGLVRSLATAMANGTFSNYAPIAFDRDGRLVDGQHRLTAQVLSGATITYYTATIMDESALEHIDCGLARTMRDRLVCARGIALPNQVVAAMQIMVNPDPYTWSSPRWVVDSAAVVRLYNDYTGLIERLVHINSSARYASAPIVAAFGNSWFHIAAVRWEQCVETFVHPMGKTETLPLVRLAWWLTSSRNVRPRAGNQRIYLYRLTEHAIHDQSRSRPWQRIHTVTGDDTALIYRCPIQSGQNEEEQE